MKKAKKVLAGLLSFVLALGVLSGCGNSKPSGSDGNTSQPSTEKTDNGKPSGTSEEVALPGVENELEMKLSGDIDESGDKVLTTLIDVDASPAFNGNPFDSVAGVNWSIQPFLFDYLAFFSPYPERDFKVSMLESYEFNNEDKSTTMTLKDGLKWSDGSDLTIDDVITNYYMQVTTSSIWNYLEKLERLDDKSIKLTYSVESDLLLNLTFNNPVMAPTAIYGKFADQFKDLIENGREYDEDLKIYKFTTESSEKIASIREDLLKYAPKPNEVIGSGPYVISNYNTSEILFEVNDNYRKEPLIKKIRGLRPGDGQAFATALLSEQYSIENGGLAIDMSKQIDEKYADTLRKVFVPELSQIGYSFNTNIYPLDKPEVRKAISMMVDKDALVGIAEPGSYKGDKYNTGLLPSLQESYVDQAFLDTLQDYSYNPDEAAKLLESIGWKNEGGKWLDDKGEWVQISLATINSWPSFMLTGEAMSTMLKEQGWNIDFKPMEFGVWNEWTKNDAEKMICCTFIGGASAYAHPYDSFRDLFVANVRGGFGLLDPGEQRIFTLSSTGEEVNVSELLDKLFISTDPAETKDLVQQLMTIGNDVCGYMSVIEKMAPLRVYDTSLSLAETEMNAVQSNYYYYGNLNNIIAKMLLDDQIYFVK
jgi:peptide/nickel transport system substrate-binding protein